MLKQNRSSFGGSGLRKVEIDGGSQLEKQIFMRFVSGVKSFTSKRAYDRYVAFQREELVSDG